MRRVFGLSCWLVVFLVFPLVTTFTFADTIQADWRISAVTVFPDSALVNRLANLKLNPGSYKVRVDNLVADIIEDSLRAKGSGSAEFKILGVQLKKEFLDEVPQEKIRQIMEEIQLLNDKKKELENMLALLADEKRFLDSLQFFSKEQLPRELATRMPLPKDLDELLKFLDAKLKDNYNQGMDYQLKIREINKKLEALNQQLSQLSRGAKKIKRAIEVELLVSRPGNIELEVSCLVRGAFWQPLYDARADFAKSEVELVMYGLVKQTTGEDWNDVTLTLSTAKPAIGGRLPEITPWFLRPWQGQVLSKAALDRTVGVSRELAAPALLAQDKEIPETKVQEKGVAVTYTLAQKADVKSDGSEQKLLVLSQRLGASFNYSAFPRAISQAYLGSRVKGMPNIQLLAGKVNIYLDGEFVGNSWIDNIAPEEEFDLYLGADDNVKVKRELIEKKVDETIIAGVTGLNRTTMFKYKLSVENYKSKKITLKLFEALPVSQDDRIKVKIEKVSLGPKSKDWQDKKGVWLWELDLEPRQKQEITYTFIVEHPRSISVEGL